MPECACDDCRPNDRTWFADADGDGLGDPEDTITGCGQDGYVNNGDDPYPTCGEDDLSCKGSSPESGSTGNAGPDGMSRDAAHAAGTAAATPACDGSLDACGVCDGPGATTYYQDADGDDLGTPYAARQFCGGDDTTGYVLDDRDPDPTCQAALTDVCGICGGGGRATYHRDADGDQPGDPAAPMDFCPTDDTTGYVLDSSDTQPL